MNQQRSGTARRLFFVYVGLLVFLALAVYFNPIKRSLNLYQINRETHDLLHSLIKTKYFRMLRVNLERECELYARSQLCKSKSCAACRCDEKDIPTNWIKTDQVKHPAQGSKEIWDNERQSKNDTSMTWIWHVEDEQNDEGEYFDLDTNIESFTNYNGSTIWQMVYGQNCFGGVKQNPYETMCQQQIVFYRVISGLHTSISTHLARFYKNISQVQMWADLKDSNEFFVNHALYQDRVLNHPDRVQNLLLIYQIYLRAIKQISPYMLQHYAVHSNDSQQDLQSIQLLHNLSKKFQNYEFKPFDDQLKTFFYPQNPKVQLYQRYIHNISRLMNCVQCQKCRLFGKMQTYGIGTALKILLGYNNFYKRNEVVALYNAWNKISMSVDFYYQNSPKPESVSNEYETFWLIIFGTVGGAFVIFLFVIEQIDMKKKAKKAFKNVGVPGEKKAQTKKDA